MKKCCMNMVIAVFIVLLTSQHVLANCPCTGGYSGPSLAASTIAQAKILRDDAAVVLQGFIEKSLGNEKYLFKDGTDSIVIEIDNEDWCGLVVGPKEKIEISGEIDRNWHHVEIEVNSIKKL